MDSYSDMLADYPIEIDKYGCLTVELPYSDEGSDYGYTRGPTFSFVHPSDNICSRPPAGHTYVIRHLFFILHCKKLEDGTRKLTIDGSDLHNRIGRRLKNWDIPYLLIFLSKHPDVTRLSLPCNEIESPGFINLINYISERSHFVELDVRNNNIGSPGINALFYKSHLLKLRVLRLGGNKIGVWNAKSVAEMMIKNNFIEHLDVSNIDQNESSLIHFITVMRSDQKYCNKTLKILNLNRPITQCMYSKFDTSHIAVTIGCMLRNNSSLKRLYLQKFGFYCHDIEEMFENARYNNTLILLDLSCNNIGDHGVQIISDWLQSRPSVRSLLLGHNIISNHGIWSLSRGFPFSRLFMLDISHNRFDDNAAVDFFHSLKKSPMLKKILIHGNKIGHQTAKVIHRMLGSEILEQSCIDVRPYQIDGIFQVAYNEIEKCENYEDDGNLLKSSKVSCIFNKN